MSENEKNNLNNSEQIIDSKNKKLDSDKERIYVDEIDNKKSIKLRSQKLKKHKWKKFFYGIGKEFGRVSWLNKKEIGTSFAIVLVVVIFFALIFTGISILMAIL
ncbi:MAG: preprotein translocase subunit SecE [Malacoplasma sp.]|nr:preprotein translocase subunit SecE [Malacoplasma sp.]